MRWRISQLIKREAHAGGSCRRIKPDDSLALIAVDLAHLVFEVKEVPVNHFSPPHWQRNSSGRIESTMTRGASVNFIYETSTRIFQD